MSIFYNEGETKKRPGVYKRYENVGIDTGSSSRDGICAIPVQANWGPLGKVVRNTSEKALVKNYGDGTYGSGYTVPAAAAMFKGGASTVYTYRMGTGGKAASLALEDSFTATAKHVGTMPISIAVQEKLGDATKKELKVYAGNALKETFVFNADKTAEGASLIAAASESEYVTFAGNLAVVPVTAVASGALTGGENPTVTAESYSSAFAAFETYYYNTIALDVDDDASLSKSLLLQAYLDNAHKHGKNGMGVVGEKTSVAFATRCAHATSFNDELVVYLGGGFKAGSDDMDGVLAICYAAGVIAATPSNQGITHIVINGATELCESLTYEQYESAIESGMLMLSMSPEGLIWFDSGINTLVTPGENQDEGWKKIRRVKVRFEIFDRIDRVLEPKVGRVSADSNGIADCVQAGQRELDAMVKEGKLMTGPVFMEDPENPYTGDSAWFIIQTDDIDSLEKMYLSYQFRYSQQA